MKYAFYVSNNATTLKKFIIYIANDHNVRSILESIKFVYIDNCNNSELRTLLNRFSIELVEKDLSNTKGKKKNEIISTELLIHLESKKTDYLFVFGERLLVGDLLTKFKNRIINFHPSLLPAFKGFKAIDKGLEYGSLIIGNTAHFVDEGIDTGSIIMQNIFITKEYKGYRDLIDNQIAMIISLINWINQDRLKVDGRIVRVENAKYQLENFIPNLEFDFKYD
jgi:phosphoribosylglycinamide formyltransferase-1